MNHRLVLIFCLVCLSFHSCSRSFAASERPNVIIILTDDQGWGDLSLHGNTNLNTPHLDQLAKDGAQFSHFYVCPVCSPTRAEMLTGRWHPRGGVRDVSRGGERLDLDETTMADAFKAAGYRTGLFGKWHNGTQGQYHPNARGFDEFYGFTSGHWGHYFSPILEQNDDLTRGEGYLPDDLTDHAMDFISTTATQPFFALLTLNTPHSPMQVPEAWWRRVENREIAKRSLDPGKEDIQFTRAAMAMVENVDWNVGRIMRMLDENQLAKNTIVVFFCDNGPNSNRWNGGMKGQKGSVDEGGIRSPLFIRWPGTIAPQTTIQPIAGAIDLFPTLAEFASISPPQTNSLDGRSLVPLLKKPETEWQDRILLAHWNKKVSARNQRFRLDESGRLFDIENDHGQTKDVAESHPEVHRKLTEAVQSYRVEVLSQLTSESRPLTIADSSGNKTTLFPARDATLSGGLLRSSKHPNCSYITNWKLTEDRIQWDVQITEKGTFDIDILYTCEGPEIGSEVELFSVTDGKEQVVLSFRVDRSAESPLIGAAEDRVPRTESLVKDFSTLHAGQVALSDRTSSLALRAKTVSGQQVMDFRLMRLRRVTNLHAGQ